MLKKCSLLSTVLLNKQFKDVTVPAKVVGIVGGFGIYTMPSELITRVEKGIPVYQVLKREHLLLNAHELGMSVFSALLVFGCNSMSLLVKFSPRFGTFCLCNYTIAKSFIMGGVEPDCILHLPRIKEKYDYPIQR